MGVTTLCDDGGLRYNKVFFNKQKDTTTTNKKKIHFL